MSKKLMVLALTFALAAAMIGGATMAWFTDSAASDPVEFAAGTLLIEAGTSGYVQSQYFDPNGAVYVYGVNNNGLYEIDVKSLTANKFHNIELTCDTYYPNGLAFDNENRRLYFANNKTLYFYDFINKEQVKAGTLSGDIYGATFADGQYWYIPNNTNKLYNVSFNNDGTIANNGSYVQIGDSNLRFGDIALDYSNGVIYGSDLDKYFTYDINSGAYNVVEGATANHLQIAFGSDGKLYGHGTGSCDWYTIDDEGMKSCIGKGSESFNDLASGYISVWNPGDCSKIKYFVRNVGTKNAYVRVNLDSFWEDFDNWEEIPAYTDVVTIEACDDTPWVKVGNYFYYTGNNSILEPGETAELCVKVCLDGPKTTNEYQGKTFVITGTFDAIQTTNDAINEHADWKNSGFNPGP